jgi:hypothetical protein
MLTETYIQKVYRNILLDKENPMNKQKVRKKIIKEMEQKKRQ